MFGAFFGIGGCNGMTLDIDLSYFFDTYYRLS